MNDAVNAATWNPVWESIFSSRSWGKYPSESIIRSTMQRFGKTPDRSQIKVLDLGCGPGANAWFLAREGFGVCAIDGSPSAIRQLQARLTADGLNADLRIGDFTSRLPWDDCSFDFIIDNVSVCANPLRAMRLCLSEVRRLLKPGGHFVSLGFTDRTWGYGQGTVGEDEGASAGVPEGPLQGTGYIQFLTYAQVLDLYSEFSEVTVETTSYSLQQRSKLVDMWVVNCRKPSEQCNLGG